MYDLFIIIKKYMVPPRLGLGLMASEYNVLNFILRDLLIEHTL